MTLRSRLLKWRKTTRRRRVKYLEAKKVTARLERDYKKSKLPLRLRAYEVAASQVGVMEVGGNNRGPEVTKIIRANGGTGPEPWCGDAVAYWYRLAGSKLVSRVWASVPLIGRVVGLRKTSKPRRGDIVRFEFTGDSTPDHVGIFVRDLGAFIETIEGNTGATGAVSDSTTGGDGVYRKKRPKSQIRDYYRVTR